MPTVGALRREIARSLTATSPTAALDARLLVAHAIGVDSSAVVLADDRQLSSDARLKALALAARRAAGEPVARILGEKEFWGLTFKLSPETLVPRPDTETVVAAALAAVEGRRRERLRILDLGTGSGAILLALLFELPEATGIGADLAPGAVATASANAARLGLAGRAAFVVSDWAAAVAGRFDLVVANPPYIPAREIAALPLEVGRFDPHLALDGGEDGLAAHGAIMADLGRLLEPGGHAFLEVGAGQAEAVAGLATTHGLAAGRHRDLALIERVVELRRADRG